MAAHYNWAAVHGLHLWAF